jgi:hypothetical protein
MTDITSIVDYYKNLLITQYHDKPKAQATISLMIAELLAAGIALDVRDGYNLDTAVGAQLDVLGKYIGVDRFYQDNDLSDMFSLETYGEADPTADARWGFVTYANYDTALYNGVLNYQSILSKNFFLTDSDYRQLLKLKIVNNYSNGSHKSIDDTIFAFFGADVTVAQTAEMEMTYTVPFTLSALLNAAIIKGILPKPMGVNLIVAVI